jgi:hypothetical protein
MVSSMTSDVVIGSAVDPYILKGVPGVVVNRRVAGKTMVHPAPVAGETTGVFLSAGQSLLANSCETTYTVTATKVQNMSIFNGAVYTAADPLIGCTNEVGNVLCRLGDKLRASLFDRVIFIPMSVGSTTVADWAGANLVGHFGVAKRRCDAVGLTISGVLWDIGIQDASDGTSQASYAASQSAVFAAIRAAGITAPIFVALEAYPYTNAGVRAAQAAAVDAGAGIYAGPDEDLIAAGSRYDGAHFNATGADEYATAWYNALNAYF